ncbi:hypothetical protein TNCV_3473141 [Trichonephila clavipes]|nr:hypothetical protein TNCV_3473141 [Trichonephila clavipes]
MVLKANDRRSSCPCHDEFRGPRSDYVRQVALATTTTTTIKIFINIRLSLSRLENFECVLKEPLLIYFRQNILCNALKCQKSFLMSYLFAWWRAETPSGIESSSEVIFTGSTLVHNCKSVTNGEKLTFQSRPICVTWYSHV